MAPIQHQTTHSSTLVAAQPNRVGKVRLTMFGRRRRVVAAHGRAAPPLHEREAVLPRESRLTVVIVDCSSQAAASLRKKYCRRKFETSRNCGQLLPGRSFPTGKIIPNESLQTKVGRIGRLMFLPESDAKEIIIMSVSWWSCPTLTTLMFLNCCFRNVLISCVRSQEKGS